MPRDDFVQPRGGTAALWASRNPVLAFRELGVETDTHRMKIGDNVTHWNDLPYVTGPVDGDNVSLQVKRDTDANLAALTTPFLSGQLVYNTDTKAIKIGDGSSLYNNLPDIKKYYQTLGSIQKIAYWTHYTNPETYNGPDWDGITGIGYCSFSAGADGHITIPSDLTIFNTIKNRARANYKKIYLVIDCMSSTTIDNLILHPTVFASDALNIYSTYGIDGIILDFEVILSTNSVTSGQNKPLYETFQKTLWDTLKEYDPNCYISFNCVPNIEVPYRNLNLNSYTDSISLMAYEYQWQNDATTITFPNCPYNDAVSFDLTDSIELLLQYYYPEKIVINLPLYGHKTKCDSDLKGATITGIDGDGFSNLKTSIDTALRWGKKWDSDSNTPWVAWRSGSNAVYDACDILTNWSGPSYINNERGTLSIDNVDYVTSTGSVKMTTTSAGTGALQIYRTISDLSLTKYNQIQISYKGTPGKRMYIYIFAPDASNFFKVYPPVMDGTWQTYSFYLDQIDTIYGTPLYSSISNIRFLMDAPSAGDYFQIDNIIINNQDESWYQIWYDDEQSLNLKYRYITQKGLGGIAFFACGYDINYPHVWKTFY